MTTWYFIVSLYQNLRSQFSICRHLGGFLFFMIINGAAANSLVQEIFIWVSDNVLRRNSPKGNYGVSALLFGTSLFTDALGKWVTPVTPWIGGLCCCLWGLDGRIFYSCRREMQRGPLQPPQATYLNPLHAKQSSPCRNHFIINLETKAYLISHENPPSHLPLFLFWGKWQVFFPLALSFWGWSSFPASWFFFLNIFIGV